MALPENALTTVAAVCAELSLPAPTTGSADEADLEGRIAAASDAIEGYCGREFGKVVDFVESVAGHGTDVLMLSRLPLLSVSSVSLDGEAVPVADYEPSPSPADGRIGALRRSPIAEELWCWTARLRPGPSYDKQAGTERRAYTVTYTAGYVLPKDATADSPRTLPYDVERACILTVVAGAASKGRDTSITSESVLDASVTYAAPGAALGVSGLPLEAERLLERYRSVL
jgi:hypothetical protein